MTRRKPKGKTPNKKIARARAERAAAGDNTKTTRQTMRELAVRAADIRQTAREEVRGLKQEFNELAAGIGHKEHAGVLWSELLRELDDPQKYIERNNALEALPLFSVDSLEGRR